MKQLIIILALMWALFLLMHCRERTVKTQGFPGLWTLIDADSLTGDRLRGLSQNTDLDEEWTFSEGVLKEYFDAQDTIWISGDTFYLNDANHWVLLAPYKQTLSFSNPNLLISGGNSVDLSVLAVSGNQSATYTIAETGTQADYNTDGTSDQVEIQAAVDALPATGGRILLREGQFNISQSVRIPSTKKITISGQGSGTVISISAGDTAFVVKNATQTGYNQQEDLIIERMRINGSNASNTWGIYLENKHLSLIQDIVFDGDSLTAIALKRTNNIKITKNYFNRCQRGVYGLAGTLVGDDLEDIAIVANDFSYVGRSAIHLESSSGVWQRDVSKIVIAANNIEEADFDRLYKPAIYLKNSKGSTITANTITQTYRGEAIELEGGSLNIVSSNVFRENGINQEVGDTTSTVMIRSSDSNVFIGNTISNENADYGFTFISSSNNEFIGNISEFDSLTTYRQFGGSGNVVWSPQGGGGGTFDPDASIAFTGNNTHTGTETFTGIDRISVQNAGSHGAYFTVQAAHTANTAAGIKTYAHSGSVASPAATRSGQFIGLWSARGVATTTLLTAASAYLGFVADSNWGSGDTPSRAVIATTPDGSATSAIRMYIDHDGDVALGSSAPATSARLDITGTTGGLLLPRLNSTQRDALTGSAGLMIFNTTIDSVQIYTSGGWRSM